MQVKKLKLFFLYFNHDYDLFHEKINLLRLLLICSICRDQVGLFFLKQLNNHYFYL